MKQQPCLSLGPGCAMHPAPDGSLKCLVAMYCHLSQAEPRQRRTHSSGHARRRGRAQGCLTHLSSNARYRVHERRSAAHSRGAPPFGSSGALVSLSVLACWCTLATLHCSQTAGRPALRSALLKKYGRFFRSALSQELVSGTPAIQRMGPWRGVDCCWRS
jgi:hypothetical protein